MFLRNINVDILKFILSLLVVTIHTDLFKDISPYISYLITNGIARIAVPVFCLINGYYFYDTVMKKSAGQWLRKIANLYVLWMLIYSVFWFRISNEYNILLTLKYFIYGFFQLWYIQAVFFTGLLLMLLKNNIKILCFIAILFLIFNIGIEYLSNFNVFKDKLPDIHNFLSSDYMHRNIFLTFPFFVAGFLIKKYQLDNYIRLSRLILLMVLFIPLSILEINNNYIKNQSMGFDNMLWILPVSIILFLLVIKKPVYKKKQFFNFGYYANGIFLTHTFFILLIKEHFKQIHSIELYLIVILVSLLITAIIKYKAKTLI